MKLRIAFVIQAEKDEEMPENVLACCAISHILYDDATPVEV